MARLKGFKAVLAIFIFTLSFNSLVFANSEDLPETTWGEIKQWQPLGLRWAIGKDMAGNALAIYDLSYPGLGLPISMGAVGGKSLGTKQMVKLLMLAKDVEDADEDDLDDAANDLKQVQDEDYGNRLFPENWWKETPWKLLGRQSEQNEP